MVTFSDCNVAKIKSPVAYNYTLLIAQDTSLPFLFLSQIASLRNGAARPLIGQSHTLACKSTNDLSNTLPTLIFMYFWDAHRMRAIFSSRAKGSDRLMPLRILSSVMKCDANCCANFGREGSHISPESSSTWMVRIEGDVNYTHRDDHLNR